MTNAQDRALELIRAQQKQAGEGSTVWCAGEQLADITMAEPESAELLARDLELPEMSIEKADGKIRAYADKNRKGAKSFGVSPLVADGILRKFYGLPERNAGKTAGISGSQTPAEDDEIRLEAFF